jgi:hypothetical protein
LGIARRKCNYFELDQKALLWDAIPTTRLDSACLSAGVTPSQKFVTPAVFLSALSWSAQTGAVSIIFIITKREPLQFQLEKPRRGYFGTKAASKFISPANGFEAVGF